ncbi:MAG TPA: hypothetical protein VI409_02805 [Gaiellaceae bacterium]|nr:hypothetical protein [Gaiellaceae bacterium]
MIDAADRKRERDRERYRTRYASDDAWAERERDRKRIANMTLDQIVRKQERNALRLFCGASYLGTADSLEQAEMLNAHVAMRLLEFKERQTLKRAAWQEPECSTPLPDAGRSGRLRIVIRPLA